MPPKVLVVDDKYYVRQLLAAALGLKGYRVLLAVDGEEGLDLARREQPDLILLDLIMPGRDGLDVLRELRSCWETAAIPVVLMSARADLDPQALPPGAADCLFKPFDLDFMEAMVERHLAAWRGVVEAAAAGEAAAGRVAPGGA